MANNNAPFGFRPVGRLDGAPWNGKYSTRKIQNAFATAIFTGDLVVAATTGYITRAAAAAGRVLGVMWGCKYYDTVQQKVIWSQYYPASAPALGDIDVYVIDDPNVIFEGQATSTAIAFADIGANIDITATAGDTLTGISKETLDQATVAVTATLPFRIIGRSNKPDNDNSSTFNRALVILNGSDYKSQTGI